MHTYVLNADPSNLRVQAHGYKAHISKHEQGQKATICTPLFARAVAIRNPAGTLVYTLGSCTLTIWTNLLGNGIYSLTTQNGGQILGAYVLHFIGAEPIGAEPAHCITLYSERPHNWRHEYFCMYCIHALRAAPRLHLNVLLGSMVPPCTPSNAAWQLTSHMRLPHLYLRTMTTYTCT